MFIIGAVNQSLAFNITGKYILDYCSSTASRGKLGNSDVIKIKTKDGLKYVLFKGGSNQTSGNDIQGLTIGGCYLTEINNLNPGFINECFNRIKEAGSKGFIFGTLNPKSPKHWFYKDFLDNWEREQNNNAYYLNYMHCTIYDKPNLTQDFLDNYFIGQDPNSINYHRNYLGERYDSNGELFRINPYNIIDDYDIHSYSSYIICCDPGETISATSIIMLGIRYDKNKNKNIMTVLKEYYHINNKHNSNPKMYIDYARDLVKFKLDCKDQFGAFPLVTLIDQSEEFFRNYKIACTEKNIGTNSMYPSKPKDEKRIEVLSNLLYTGQLEIYKDCIHTLSSLRNAKLDDKATEKGELKIKDVFDAEGHADALDALTYSVLYYYKRL